MEKVSFFIVLNFEGLDATVGRRRIAVNLIEIMKFCAAVWWQ